jgi:hypothetical protein
MIDQTIGYAVRGPLPACDRTPAAFEGQHDAVRPMNTCRAHSPALTFLPHPRDPRTGIAGLMRSRFLCVGRQFAARTAAGHLYPASRLTAIGEAAGLPAVPAQLGVPVNDRRTEDAAGTKGPGGPDGRRRW